MSADEIWKDIPGYGGHYQASSEGQIRVKDRVVIRRHPKGMMVGFKYKSKILRPSKTDEWGHLSVTLGVDGVDYSRRVHTLVLLAFVGECPEGMECCHNNGIAWDNSIGNLRWDTHAANNGDRVKHGTYATGQDHPMVKFSEDVRQGVISGEISIKDAIGNHGMSSTHAWRLSSMRSQS